MGGVTTQTVTKWRRRLGITGQQTKGTSRLRSVYFDDFGDRVCQASRAKDRDPERLAKISAARKGKKRPKHVIEALRKANLGKKASAATRAKLSEVHKRRGTRPPWIGEPWSAEED